VPVESAKDQDGAAALPEGERRTSVNTGPVIALLLICYTPYFTLSASSSAFISSS